MEHRRFKKSIVIGAGSVRGPLHERNQLPNQDSFAYFHSEQIVAIAVADGLGSAIHSEEGSGYATHLAVQLLITYLYHHESASPHIPNIQSLRQNIIDRWQKQFGQTRADYDTTLLFIGLTPTLCVMGQIGDGLILYRYSDPLRACGVFQQAQKEYLNKPESSLAQPDALEYLRVQEYSMSPENDYSAILLMTDGVADDLSDHDLYSKELIRMLSEVPAHRWNSILNEHLTEWPTPGHYDDKTLALLTFEDQERKDPTISMGSQSDTERLEETGVPESNISEASRKIATEREAS
jgi:hypothetical protein